MLRYCTAGESHGPLLLGILEGMPAGLSLVVDDMNRDLARRQIGYGRGGRMRIEQDRAEIVSGVRFGRTLGSPIGLLIRNKDWVNWQERMAVAPPRPEGVKAVTRPRPGHADLTGAIKYAHEDARDVLERASARETAMRVAVGAVTRRLLREFGVAVVSHVVEIGGIMAERGRLTPRQVAERAERSDVRCADPAAEAEIKKRIDAARKQGDTLGGVFEVIATGLPSGLGTYAHWDRKLDGRLARALMSINAIKGVEVGMGFAAARAFGSEVHDEIFWSQSRGFYRRTNRAGGIEGGMTNGQELVVRAAMKPISTLYRPLRSVDLKTKQPFKASVERSDICAVPAAAVIGEAVVAFELANAMVEKFGGDSVEEMKRNWKNYLEYVRKL